MIRQSDPSIEVIMHWADKGELCPGSPIPTMIVALCQLHAPLPVAGHLFGCLPIPKTEQEQAYGRNRIATPRAQAVLLGHRPDPPCVGSPGGDQAPGPRVHLRAGVQCGSPPPFLAPCGASTLPPPTRSSATASWCGPSSTSGAIPATIGCCACSARRSTRCGWN